MIFRQRHDLSRRPSPRGRFLALLVFVSSALFLADPGNPCSAQQYGPLREDGAISGPSSPPPGESWLQDNSPQIVEEHPEQVTIDSPEDGGDNKREVRSIFDEGLKWTTKDGEYELQFHNETQLDMRTYAQPDLGPTNQTGFYVPRMRLIFNGTLTKPIEYNVSVNKGLGSLDLLDANLNFNYDKRLQLKVGRYRVPFTYDWYVLSNQYLMSPERSVFAINYGYNRNFGAMVHGEILEDRVDYAVCVANGGRNSYVDENSSKDLLCYLNLRPFAANGPEWLENLNVGASMANGVQEQLALPHDFRTSASASDSPGNLEAMPSFLRLGLDVTESGLKQLFELHGAFYYGGLSVLGAWDSGFNTYGFITSDDKVRLDTSGWHVQCGYLITGEEITQRGFVQPLREFDLRQGKRGSGAIEVHGRFDRFGVAPEVFSSGLADGTRWTNSVNTIDVGVNWHLTKYVKVYFDWQHCLYGQPVSMEPGKPHSVNDLFWIRTQVYF